MTCSPHISLGIKSIPNGTMQHDCTDVLKVVTIAQLFLVHLLMIKTAHFSYPKTFCAQKGKTYLVLYIGIVL